MLLFIVEIIMLLYTLLSHFINEKTLYERENKPELFKSLIKPIMGRSVKDEEFASIANLKNKEFKHL